MPVSEFELNVVGKDHIEIELDGRPRHVKVFFKDDSMGVPCNPVSFDELTWSVIEREELELIVNEHSRHHQHQQKFYLKICWEVSDSRTIICHVSY